MEIVRGKKYLQNKIQHLPWRRIQSFIHVPDACTHTHTHPPNYMHACTHTCTYSPPPLPPHTHSHKHTYTHDWHLCMCRKSVKGHQWRNILNSNKCYKNQAQYSLDLRFSEASLTRSTNIGSSLFWASISATWRTRLARRAMFDALATISGESTVRIPSSILSVSRKMPSSENKGNSQCECSILSVSQSAFLWKQRKLNTILNSISVMQTAFLWKQWKFTVQIPSSTLSVSWKCLPLKTKSKETEYYPVLSIPHKMLSLKTKEIHSANTTTFNSLNINNAKCLPLKLNKNIQSKPSLSFHFQNATLKIPWHIWSSSTLK